MQEIKDYLVEYNTTKPVSKATKFLWWCAGADAGAAVWAVL